MAGTEVIYDESSAPWSLAPREWVHPDERARRVAERRETPTAPRPLPRSRTSELRPSRPRYPSAVPETAVNAPSRLLLAAPRGYCAGVDRAVQTVEHALELHGPPVYVRKEIVHNKHVVEQLTARGAIFVEEETEVPEGELVVFSAHGVAPCGPRELGEAQPAHDRRHLPARHQGPRRGPPLRRAGLHDHPGRPRRPRGGRGDDRRGPRLDHPGRDRRGRRRASRFADPERVAFITQTTLSVDETVGDHRPAASEVPGDHEPEVRRHLLRDDEPPARGQAARPRVRPGPRDRLEELVQLQPARRRHPRARHRLPPDRQGQPRSRRRGSRASTRSGSPPEPAPPRSWSPSSSSSSATAARRTSPSCGRSTRTSASCCRSGSGSSWPRPAPPDRRAGRYAAGPGVNASDQIRISPSRSSRTSCSPWRSCEVSS